VRGGDLPPRGPIEYLAYMRPRDLEVLAFPQVLDALAALAVSTVGAEACRALRPLADRRAADQALATQWSLLRLAETSGTIPLAPFPDVREALALASHDGAILAGDRLVEVRTVLRQARTARQFLAPKVTEHPALAHLPRRLEAFPEIEAALSRMLDDGGVLLDDASPLLAELRARLRDMRQELETRLQRLVSRDTADERMADRYVTVRNNRFVVPMKAAAAPQIDGVVQDRSASGETLFVEPLFAIERARGALPGCGPAAGALERDRRRRPRGPAAGARRRGRGARLPEPHAGGAADADDARRALERRCDPALRRGDRAASRAVRSATRR